VHCDVKAANVLLAEPEPAGGRRVVLSDFGIAALQPVGDGTIVGTPSFMAPEQLSGDRRAIEPRTDLYAVGVLAWWAATGRAPFQGDVRSLRRQHLHEAPPPFQPRFPVPEGFEAWIRRLLRKPVGERFASAGEAAWAL